MFPLGFKYFDQNLTADRLGKSDHLGLKGMLNMLTQFLIKSLLASKIMLGSHDYVILMPELLYFALLVRVSILARASHIENLS